VALFTPRADDPKSDARPAIWDNFDDFTTKARALETLGAGLAGSIRTVDDVRAAMLPLGGACSDCHTLYRD
jgi:cytochrome c556